MPFDLEFVRQNWPQPVVYFDSIDSTMLEAARLAEAGGPHGAAVVADEQTEGQGRHGHSWHSERNSGLYVSIVLRPRISGPALPLLTLALGLATADAIAETARVNCDLRWPNDVMLEGKKAAGILVQLLEASVIAGVGVNVNQAAFPPEIAREATSLRIISNRVHSREHLLLSLLAAVDRYSGILAADGGGEAILNMFSSRSSYARNKRVRVAQGTAVLEGVTAGLDASGFLKVRRDDGSEEMVLAGGIRPVD